MMGCGKTTVAKELSLLVKGFEYVDIDEDIERSTQKKISELFLKHGEPFFRRLETDRIKLVCKSNNQIISVGGGAFEREENRQHRREKARGLTEYSKIPPRKSAGFFCQNVKTKAGEICYFLNLQISFSTHSSHLGALAEHTPLPCHTKR